MPAGKAMMAIPTKEESIAIALPKVDIGYRSPYPTVVSKTHAQ